eukprot:12020107-Alexandrium_andersonii.AAC.1
MCIRDRLPKELAKSGEPHTSAQPSPFRRRQWSTDCPGTTRQAGVGGLRRTHNLRPTRARAASGCRSP